MFLDTLLTLSRYLQIRKSMCLPVAPMYVDGLHSALPRLSRAGALCLTLLDADGLTANCRGRAWEVRDASSLSHFVKPLYL